MSSLFSPPSSTRLLHPPTLQRNKPTRSPLIPSRPNRPAPVAAVAKKYKGTAMREEKLTEMIEKKVAEAMAACDGDEAKGSDGCKVAWDEVEEVSQAKADLRRRLAESEVDPLESFCRDNPETDECRVYED